MPKLNDTVQDWYVSLQPRDPRADDRHSGTGHLTVLRGTEEDAIEMLEFYADMIRTTDHVPDGLDWRNRSMASVVRRWGKRTFLVRVDCFEIETDNGMTQGHGWLRAHPAA